VWLYKGSVRQRHVYTATRTSFLPKKKCTAGGPFTSPPILAHAQALPRTSPPTQPRYDGTRIAALLLVPVALVGGREVGSVQNHRRLQ
jgi:hypothetical protein